MDGKDVWEGSGGPHHEPGLYSVGIGTLYRVITASGAPLYQTASVIVLAARRRLGGGRVLS